MNLLVTFFLAPVTAFFLPKVYRDAARASWLRGMLYSLYGAFLISTLILLIFVERGATSDKFIHWIKKKIPVVIWTPDGLSLENGQRSAALIHPVYGPIAVFNADRESVSDADIGELFFFVTSKKIVFRKLLGQLDERDVTKTTLPAQQLPSRIRITGELIENFYREGKRTFLSVAPGVASMISLATVLIVNLAYASLGLLINLIRTHRLRYGGIFSLACFATSITLATICLTEICLIFSFSLPAPLIPMSFFISLIYMVAAITLTDSATPQPLPKTAPPAPAKDPRGKQP